MINKTIFYGGFIYFLLIYHLYFVINNSAFH